MNSPLLTETPKSQLTAKQPSNKTIETYQKIPYSQRQRRSHNDSRRDIIVISSNHWVGDPWTREQLYHGVPSIGVKSRAPRHVSKPEYLAKEGGSSTESEL